MSFVAFAAQSGRSRHALCNCPFRMRTRIRIVTSFAALATASAVANVAAAQEGDGERRPAVPDVPRNSPAGVFGDRGQLAISSDAGLSLTNTSVSGVDGSTTSLILRPAVDYFVIDHLSVGGFLGLAYVSTSAGSSTSFSVGPRVGYDIPVSRRFSIWPKAGLSIGHTSEDIDDPDFEDDTGESNTSLQLNLFVPVMFHPVDHFFLGLGPALDQDLSGDNKATTIAVRLTLGGWI
jgi:hypothetical protein